MPHKQNSQFHGISFVITDNVRALISEAPNLLGTDYLRVGCQMNLPHFFFLFHVFLIALLACYGKVEKPSPEVAVMLLDFYF